MLRFSGDIAGQLSKTLQDFSKKMQQEANKREVKKELATESIHSMRIRVQGQGMGVSATDGDSIRPVPLRSHKDFTEAYVNQRIRLKRRGELSSQARIRFQNATATGQMLDAISSRVTAYGFDLEIGGRRRDGKDNADIVEYYEKLRPFFAMTDGEERILSTNFRNILRERARLLAKRS